MVQNCNYVFTNLIYVWLMCGISYLWMILLKLICKRPLFNCFKNKQALTNNHKLRVCYSKSSENYKLRQMLFRFMRSEKISVLTSLSSLASSLSKLQFTCMVMSNSLQPHRLSMPGLPVHHQLPEFTQTHVH